MTLRDSALKAIGTLPAEQVTVDGLTFEVRGLSVGDANELYERLSVRKGGQVTVDTKKWNVEWVIACVHDPDTGNKVFEAADRDSLQAGRSDFVTELARAAAKLSGYGADDDEAARALKADPTLDPGSS